MSAKNIFVVFLAVIAVSSAFKDSENELVNAALSSGTNLMRELSKAVAENPDKYSVDLNALYKKYEISSKADQTKSFIQAQYKKGAEMYNDYFKKVNIESEEGLKKLADEIKKEDPVLAEKITKFYDKSCDLDRTVEDIVKYVLDPERVNKSLEKIKAALAPLEHKLAEAIKKFETIVVEHLPKKGKK